jgi:hypothetical protein
MIYKSKYIFLGSLPSALLASGVTLIENGWGLDASWIWSMTHASREKLYQKGEFIWTYGPLGYWDFVPNDWFFGFLLSSLFSILCSCALYVSLFKTFNIKSSRFLSFIMSTLLTTYMGVINEPTLLLVSALTSATIYSQLTGKIYSNKICLTFLAAVTAIFFYIKIFPFILTVIVSILILWQENTLESTKRVMRYFALCIFLALVLAVLIGFNLKTYLIWIDGYFELTIGYSAMEYKSKNYISDNILFFVLLISTIFIAISLNFSRKNITGFLLISLVFYTYGFTRHDSFHTKVTFSWLILVTIVLTVHFGRKSVLIINLIICLIISPVSLLETPNVMDKIRTETKSVLRSVHPEKLKETQRESQTYLKSMANLPNKIQRQIDRQEVAIYPWDQLIAKAYGLNFSTFPIPQSYSAYTPKLDELNAQFLNRRNSPKYLLLTEMKAIDERNPLWESPKTVLAMLCNYRWIIQTSGYLLLQKREFEACLDRQNLEQTKQNVLPASSIELVAFSQKKVKQSFIPNFFFRNSPIIEVTFNSTTFKLNTANSEELVMNVPPHLDLPGKWRIGSRNTVSSNYGIFKYTELRTNLSKF